MRFEPVHFSKSYPTIRKAHGGNSFQLSPPTPAISFSQDTQNPNARPDRDGFDIPYASDNRKMHRESSSRNQARDQKRGAGGEAANQRGLQGAAQWPRAGITSLDKAKDEQCDERQRDRE